MTGAFEAGGLENLDRQREEMLPEQEGSKSHRGAGNDDPLVGVQPAEPCNREVVRQDRHMDRYHKRREQNQEEEILAWKGQVHESIRRQRTQNDLRGDAERSRDDRIDIKTA